MKFNAKLIKKENAQATIEIVVDKEEVKNQFDKITKNYQEKATLPGFRTGKAPLNIVKTKYKTDIFNDVLNELINHSYFEALDKVNINPYTQPSIKLKKFSEEENLEFEAEIQTRPEIKIDKYKDINLVVDDYNFDKKDTEQELLKLQERSADLITKENKKIEEDNIAFLDIKAYDSDNKNIKEMNNDNFRIEVAQDKIDKEFYEALLGAHLEEERDIKKHYEDSIQNKMLAGKDVLFKVKIKEIREKKLPKLDDEFAKDIGYENFEELKKTIETQMTKMIENYRDNLWQKEIIKKIIEHSEFQIPEKLIQNRIDELMQEFQYRLHSQGQNIKELVAQKIINIDQIRKDLREQAMEDIKTSLVLVQVADKENLKVEELEIEDFIKEEAAKTKTELEEYKKKIKPENISFIKQYILNQKVVNFLKANSKIKKGKSYPYSELLKKMEQRV